MKPTESTLSLIDYQQRQIGQIKPESLTNDLLEGLFIPGPDFAAVAPLFQRFEDAVNAQALHVVDQIDGQIAELNMLLSVPDHSQSVNVHDVQIWSSGSFSCRLSDMAFVPVIRALQSSENGHSVSSVQLALPRL
jgi:hypothetical protein